MGRYLRSHFAVAIIYFLVVLVVGGGWSIDLGYLMMMGLKFLGVLVGVYLLFVDRVVYTYAYPGEQLSQHFVWYWKNKQYGNAFRLLDSRRSEQEKLTFRSVIFMAIWVPLAFFALTSTSVVFGKGVVMGLMLHILYDSWRLQRIDPEKLNRRLFWQVKQKFGREEQVAFLIVISVVFVWFSLWFA